MYSIGYNVNVIYWIQLFMNKSEILLILGSRVRELRKSKGLTQTELAHVMGKDHPSINKLENGKVNPSYIFLCEVAEALEVELKNIIP